MPAGTRRTRNKKGEGDRLRADLLAAATDILRERGGDAGLALREVARRAQVSATAVYLHFGDKEQIIDAVLAEQFTALTDELAAAVRPTTDAGAALRAGCRAYLGFAERDPAMYRLLFEGGITRPALPPGAADPPGRQTFGYLVEGLTRCEREGVIPSADQQRVATVLWTALHGIATLRRVHPNFPWPSADPLLDDVLHRIAGLRPASG